MLSVKACYIDSFELAEITLLMTHLQPVEVTLRNGNNATLFPVPGSEEIKEPMLRFLMDLFNAEIEAGQTYPQEEKFTDLATFNDYWHHYFTAILVEGAPKSLDDAKPEDVIGTFYIKPNYVGRCSHVCNAGFLVNPKKRGTGAGSLMGAQYPIWAKELGYEYSVFNLVFVTNTASIKIWDKLGFDRIGLVPGVARLKGIEGRVDAIMFGKKL